MTGRDRLCRSGACRGPRAFGLVCVRVARLCPPCAHQPLPAAGRCGCPDFVVPAAVTPSRATTGRAGCPTASHDRSVADEPPQVPQTLLLTIREAADELRISENSVYRLISIGMLPSTNIAATGRRARTRIPRRALEQYIAERTDYRPRPSR